MVIAQESAQSLAAQNGPVAADGRTPREQQDVALPLMISLGMEMVDILTQSSPFVSCLLGLFPQSLNRSVDFFGRRSFAAHHPLSP
jgi:hypothetical protein